MASQSYRLFVGNLPLIVKEDEIRKKFRKYGTVESIEIRSKKDPSGDVSTTFCYVNLNSDDNSLRKGLQQLNGFEWEGQRLKVEVAKESFLQRLQRERQSVQAASVHARPQEASHPFVAQKKSENGLKTSNENNVFSRKKPASNRESSSESSDSDDESDTSNPRNVGFNQSNGSSETQTSKLKSSKRSTQFHSQDSDNILKKFESFSNVWKDEDEISSDPLDKGLSKKLSSLIKSPRKDTTLKQSDRKSFKGNDECDVNQKTKASGSERSKAAEEKRLKSIEERKQVYEQQKKAIQSALSDKKGPKLNKKIVFEDDMKPSSKPAKSSNGGRKATLFDDSDNEVDEDGPSISFEVKKQFEGKKGKKLLDLQSRFNNDQRFQLDERFCESDEEVDRSVSSRTESKSQQAENGFEGVEGIAEEREQQLKILSSILGQSVPIAEPSSESKAKGMLRFDPSKPNHSRFELSKAANKNVKSNQPNDEKLVDSDDDEEEDTLKKEPKKKKMRVEEKPPEPVSKETFYSVSDTLTGSLKQAKDGESSGFSLLQLFGTPNDPTENIGKEEIHEVIEKKKKIVPKKPAIWENASSDEENEADSPSAPKICESQSSTGVKSAGGVWQENFFFFRSKYGKLDRRLQEGLNFAIQYDKSAESGKSAEFVEFREALKVGARKRKRKMEKRANSFQTRVHQLTRKRFRRGTSGQVAMKRPTRGGH